MQILNYLSLMKNLGLKHKNFYVAKLKPTKTNQYINFRLVRRQIINVRYSLVISFISFVLVSIPNAISILSVHFEEVLSTFKILQYIIFLRLSASSQNHPLTSLASTQALTSLSTCRWMPSFGISLSIYSATRNGLSLMEKLKKHRKDRRQGIMLI